MIEVYIYMLTPQDLPFFYFIDCFIARSTICYLLSATKKCIGEPSPLPPSPSRSPKTLVCVVVFCFFLC